MPLVVSESLRDLINFRNGWLGNALGKGTVRQHFKNFRLAFGDYGRQTRFQERLNCAKLAASFWCRPFFFQRRCGCVSLMIGDGRTCDTKLTTSRVEKGFESGASARIARKLSNLPTLPLLHATTL